MYLTFRRAQVSDLEEGFAFVSARHGYQNSMRKDWVKLWRALLENGHEPIMVTEDRDREPGQRSVSIGFSFFAYDWFVQEAKTTLPPFLDLQVLEKWRSGKRPFLLKNEITEDQLKDGLNAVALNWGWDTKRYGLEDTQKIMMTQSLSYTSCIPQFRLKEFMQEMMGDEERDRLMNLGVDVNRDYKEFIGTKHLPARDEKKHPYLMAVSFEEVRKNTKKEGTAIYAIAKLGPPRFGFGLSEQQVLKKALLGETDEQIAKSLHLTLVTIKRRWQAIYEKVTNVDPELLGKDPDLGNGDVVAAKQRRRFLLLSLKDHPEELWPNRPRSKASDRKKSSN